MAVFDILSDIPAGGDLQFTAAAAPPDQVAVTQPTAGGQIFRNANGDSLFTPGDNILINEIRLNTPFQFGQGNGQISLQIQYNRTVGGLLDIPEIGDDSFMYLPDLCTPVRFPGLGLFLRVPTNTTFRLVLVSHIDFNISMMNVPAELLGDNFQVHPYLHITHTLPLAP